MQPAVVAAAALGLAAGCLEFGKVQICQGLVVGQRLFDGSVLQGTGFHVSGLLVSAMESLGSIKTYLGLFDRRPEALFH